MLLICNIGKEKYGQNHLCFHRIFFPIMHLRVTFIGRFPQIESVLFGAIWR